MFPTSSIVNPQELRKRLRASVRDLTLCRKRKRDFSNLHFICLIRALLPKKQAKNAVRGVSSRERRAPFHENPFDLTVLHVPCRIPSGKHKLLHSAHILTKTRELSRILGQAPPNSLLFSCSRTSRNRSRMRQSLRYAPFPKLTSLLNLRRFEAELPRLTLFRLNSYAN